MAEQQQAQKKEKWKGKDWFQILAPKSFGEAVIGETPAIDSSILKGRVIESSLMELSGDVNRYYFKLFFKTSDIDGNKVLTRFFGHECTRDFIARIVQGRTTRIDTSQVISLTDGKIRLKTIAITNGKVTNAVEKRLRKELTDYLAKEISKLSMEQFIKAMVAGIIQNDVKDGLHTLYPIRHFEFRKSEVL